MKKSNPGWARAIRACALVAEVGKTCVSLNRYAVDLAALYEVKQMNKIIQNKTGKTAVWWIREVLTWLYRAWQLWRWFDNH